MKKQKASLREISVGPTQVWQQLWSSTWLGISSGRSCGRFMQVYLLTNRTWKMSPTTPPPKRTHPQKVSDVFSKNAQKKTCRRQKTSVSPPSRFYPLGSALDDTLRKWLLLGHSGRLETDPNRHHPQKTQFILLIFEGFPTQTHTSPFHIRVILFEDDGSSCFASHAHLFRREMWLGNEGYKHLTQTCSTGATEIFLPCARPMVLEDRPRPKSKTTPKGKRCSQYSKP